jgi:hypothetical protein
MRRSLLLLVAVLAACSGTTDITTTTALPTGSSTAAPQTLIPGALISVDPATLVPFEDAQPVLVGVSHQGVASPNGRWVAIRTDQTGDRGYRISILDVHSSLVVADVEGSGDGLQIDDEGRAVWFEAGRPVQLEITSEQTPIDAPETPSYLSDTLSILPDGRIGYLLGPEDERGAISVVVVDGEQTTVHEVGQVISGPVETDGPSLPQRAMLVPEVVWDGDNDRAIVISPDEDALVVVDLETGETTEHQFATGGSPENAGAQRDSYLTTDGSMLYIATGLLEVTSEGNTWEAVESAQQLAAIDTADWSSRLVAAQADAVYPSPDGTVLATTGAESISDSEGGAQRSQSPVFLVDTSTGEPLVGFEGRSGAIGEVQFSAAGSEMYVISEGPEGTNIDIIDVASQQLAGSLGFQRISLVGRAGLLSFHLTD